MNIHNKKNWIWLGPAAVIALALFIALFGQIVHLLWNALLPPLFGWREITFWQATGILVLSRILFGGFGSHGSNDRKSRRRLRDRWDALTPEERERFRQSLRGPGPSTSENPA